MTDQDVWTNFIKWLETLTGLVVIKAHPSEDRPNKPYIMVNMPTISQVRQQAQDIEYEETGEETDEGFDEIKAHPVVETEWMFSVHSYGPTPTDLLRPIVLAYHVKQVVDQLNPLVLHEVSELRRIPERVKNEWEPRAQVDVFLRGLVKDGFIVDTIETYSFDVNRETT
jgi:hypothetical protein